MRKSNILAVILVVGLLLRVSFFLMAASHPYVCLLNVDAKSYDRLAVNLLDHHVFSTAEAPPYRNPLAVCLLHIVLDMTLILIVFKTAEIIIGEKAALVASAIKACDIDSIISLYSLMSEPLFNLMFSLGFFLLVRSVSETNLRDRCLSGLCLGIATLTRPVGLYISVLLLLGGLLVDSVKRRVLAKNVAALCVFFLVLTPWYVRNYVDFGGIVLSTSPQYNLLYRNALYVKATVDKKDVSDLEREYSTVFMHVANPVNAASLMAREAKEILLAHPVESMGFVIKGTVARAFSPNRQEIGSLLEGHWESSGSPEVLYKSGLYSAVIHYLQAPGGVIALIVVLPTLLGVWFLSGVGLFLGRHDHRLWVLAFIVLYFITVPLMLLLGRLRFPAMSFLSIVAAYGAVELFRYCQTVFNRSCRSI
jgi:hypothetical protein